MEGNIQKLKTEFERIYKLGWIKCNSKGTGSAGNTFELLLKKPIENFEIPDFEDIEIKTKKIFCGDYITLFSATPDGKYLFEIKRLRNTYGYPHKKEKNIKVLNISVFAKKITTLGSRFLFSLKVEKEQQKIFLCVLNRNNEIIDMNTFWTFELLEEKLYRKLKTLAIVDVLQKKVNGQSFYKYDNITFYKLKNFDEFINLIENGVIRITFKIGTFCSGKRYGEIHDHGTSFDIKEKDLEKLYNLIS